MNPVKKTAALCCHRVSYGECCFPFRDCTNTVTGTYCIGTCHVLKICILFAMKWKASMF